MQIYPRKILSLQGKHPDGEKFGREAEGAEFSNLQYGKYGKGRITGLLLLTHQNCGD